MDDPESLSGLRCIRDHRMSGSGVALQTPDGLGADAFESALKLTAVAARLLFEEATPQRAAVDSLRIGRLECDW